MATAIDRERLRSTAAASQTTTGGSGGGGVDETQRRLTAVETSLEVVRTDVTELRVDMSYVKAQMPYVATKEDVQEVRIELVAMITRVEGDLKAENRALEGALSTEIQRVRTEFHVLFNRMILWFIGTAVSLTGAVFSIMKFFQ
jgi:hypothetical protein